MGFRNADVLYAAGGDIWEKYGTFVWRTLPEEEPSHDFSRSGTAWFLDRNQRYRKAESGVLRPEWASTHDKYALRLEAGVTPVSNDSVDFQSTSAWTHNNIASTTSTTSIIKDLPTGGEARSFTSTATGRGFLEQSAGTMTGSKETLSAVIEKDSQSKAEVLIIDDTDGGVAFILLDLSTETIDNSLGDVGFRVLTDSGPNGGKVVRLWAAGSGTSGNGRTLRVFTDRADSSQETGIIHHAQHEEEAFPTSPIPFVGAPQSRPGEQFYVDDGPPPTKSVWYIAYIAGVLTGLTENFPYAVEHGNDSVGGRLRTFQDDDTAGVLRLFFDDANGNNILRSANVGDVVPGDLIERAYIADPSDGSVRLVARKNEGAAQDSGKGTPSSWSTPSTFGGNERVVYNETGAINGKNRGAIKVVRHYGVDYGALDTDGFTGGADSLLDELAGHTV